VSESRGAMDQIVDSITLVRADGGYAFPEAMCSPRLCGPGQAPLRRRGVPKKTLVCRPVSSRPRLPPCASRTNAVEPFGCVRQVAGRLNTRSQEHQGALNAAPSKSGASKSGAIEGWFIEVWCIEVGASKLVHRSLVHRNLVHRILVHGSLAPSKFLVHRSLVPSKSGAIGSHRGSPVRRRPTTSAMRRSAPVTCG
jgi:hypothetical protein